MRKTYSDILFRLFKSSSVDFELLINNIRNALRVCFPLKTCPALQFSLCIRRTDCRRERVLLRVDGRGTTSVEHDLWGRARGMRMMKLKV
jgi:hypothetical protein